MRIDMRRSAGQRVLAGLLLAAAAFAGCRPSAPTDARGAVFFRTEDGFRLEGRLFGEGPRAVVLAHMFPSDQSSWSDFAEDLAGDGYRVLTFNFRGYGRSQGSREIALLGRDVSAAVDFMRKDRDAAKVVLVGASMGGTASIVAAATNPVEGVATLSAPVSFRGLDASSFVARVAGPKLFLAAEGDPGGAAGAAGKLLAASADPTARILILAGDEHGTDMLNGRRGKEVVEALVEFIAKVSG